MENLYQSIGKRICLLRRSQGLTQEKLAEALDITIKHISSVERGVSSLSLEKIIEVSMILNCTLDYLLLGEDHNKVMDRLPMSIIKILNSDNEEEILLLLDYLVMYDKLRKNME